MKKLTSEGWPWYKDRFIHKHVWPQDLRVSMKVDPEGQWWERWYGVERHEDKGDGTWPSENSKVGMINWRLIDAPMEDLDYLDLIDEDSETGFSNPVQYPNIRYWNIDDGHEDILHLEWDSEGN